MNTIHPGNFQCFIDCYKENLKKALELYPKDYAWPVSELDAVFNRMVKAIEKELLIKTGKHLK